MPAQARQPKLLILVNDEVLATNSDRERLPLRRPG